MRPLFRRKDSKRSLENEQYREDIDQMLALEKAGKRRKKKWSKKKKILVAAGILMGIGILGGNEETEEQKSSDRKVSQANVSAVKNVDTKQTVSDPIQSFSVTYLNVGQGNSALIECNDHYMLVDGGAAAASSTIYSVLEKKDVEMLDIVVSSTVSDEYVGGLSGALQKCTADKVLATTTEAVSDVYATFLNSVVSENVIIPSQGDTYALDAATVHVLNANPIVLQVTCEDKCFLFASAISKETEEQLCTTYKDTLQSDVLLVSDHGSDTGTSDEFVKLVHPQYAVISTDGNDGKGYPGGNVLSALKENGIEIYRTDCHGDITITSDGHSLKVKTEKQPGEELVMKEGFVPTPVPEPVVEEAPAVIEETPAVPVTNDYVINTNTGKFHKPLCKSVSKIKDSNRWDYTGTRDEVIGMGYVPCKNCNP